MPGRGSTCRPERFGIARRVIEHDEALHLDALHQDRRIVRERGAGTLAVIDRDHAALDDAVKQVHLGENARVIPSDLLNLSKMIYCRYEHQGYGAEAHGPNPWDPQIRNPALYARIVKGGSLALGESYMDGWWDAITVSKRQLELAQSRAGSMPVTFALMDYRDLPDERYDHVVSVGMFEHVGGKNYRALMQTVARVLKPDGLFVLHTIGSNVTVPAPDPWYDRYIFPNGILPSIAQIRRALEGLFVMEDWHNFGADYDKTLVAWFNNFDSAWPKLKGKYGDRFYRMSKYYLLGMAGTFRAR